MCHRKVFIAFKVQAQVISTLVDTFCQENKFPTLLVSNDFFEMMI